ncbi:CRTAC1 family protein [Muricauda oceani]|uniref:CRTAC1 family protein n=1 Tax=Flagellimonas oceani TaxID=2698672 RepID=A0A6G7J4E4_9FLAO|nr:CRTAC1 family protein [Allomuricauda oceani]MBW8243539.1 CRTAC1 family protein [Allomuricauda oceani]QII45751.1 CRTAC1 family protein [Allomuricauda oceani]
MFHSFRKSFHVVIGAICVLQFFACKDAKKSAPKPTVDFNIPTRADGEADAQTVEMIGRVRNAVGKIDITNVPYMLNSKKAAFYEDQLKRLTGKSRINVLFKYALELLNTGRTNESIDAIQEVLTAATASTANVRPEIIFAIKKQLAIAYMRKAEQDNCIINHNAESCIIPLSPRAQHILTEGSEKAIALLNELLEMNPNDLECQYLLNIAHMTLGSYPQDVPDRFKLPESHFANSSAFPHFTDIAMNLGVDEKEMAGGTCIDDFNGDGYLDILASSWGFEDQIKYFENDRVGGFVDKTLEAGLKGVTGGLNLRHADYNNDGHLDFVILRGAWLSINGGIPNSLMRNNGDGTFTDVTLEAGVYSLNPTQTAVWMDVDLDGWLDLFIANEWNDRNKSYCELYLNQQDGTFKNVAKDAGITVKGFFKGVATGDLNNDLYPDLYLSNYMGLNTLYMNTTKEKGVPSFEKTEESAGVSNPVASFPTWIFDYDNDGFEDIFVSGYSSADILPTEMMLRNLRSNATDYRPLLYKNNGDDTFTEVSLDVNLSEPIATMGCNFGDLDNDGFLDFYLATGDPSYFSIVPNRMFHNVRGEKFEDVTYSAGFGHIQKGHAIGFGDLDMDGDQDIYAVMGGALEGDTFGNLLFENPMGNKNNWINIVLEGIQSNRSAIGAKIVVTIVENGKERKIYHSVGTDSSFGGNSLMEEIGLGNAKKIKKLEIKWPYRSQNTSVFTDVQVNQVIKIKEDGSVQQLRLPKITFNKKEAMHHHDME